MPACIKHQEDLENIPSSTDAFMLQRASSDGLACIRESQQSFISGVLIKEMLSTTWQKSEMKSKPALKVLKDSESVHVAQPICS